VYNNWTRLDVVEEVSLRLRDSTNDVWAATRITRYVRDGYMEWCKQTGANWHRDHYPLVASQALYDLPDRLFKVDRMTFNGYRIPPIVSDTFRNLNKMMEVEEGIPIGYAMDGESGDEDLADTDPYQKRLRMHRVPADSYDDVYLEWESVGDDLDDDSSVLWNMADHQVLAVIFYAMWKAYSFEGSGQHLKFAAFYKQRFEEIVARTLLRKSKSRSNKQHRMGDSGPVRGGVRLARYPWNYGKVVR
jgi:hypothetical protein